MLLVDPCFHAPGHLASDPCAASWSFRSGDSFLMLPTVLLRTNGFQTQALAVACCGCFASLFSFAHEKTAFSSSTNAINKNIDKQSLVRPNNPCHAADSVSTSAEKEAFRQSGPRVAVVMETLGAVSGVLCGRADALRVRDEFNIGDAAGDEDSAANIERAVDDVVQVRLGGAGGASGWCVRGSGRGCSRLRAGHGRVKVQVVPSENRFWHGARLFATCGEWESGFQPWFAASGATQKTCLAFSNN